MKKAIAMLTVTSMLLGMWPAGVFGATDDAADAEQMYAEAAEQVETETNDNIVRTKHEAVIKGETVSYTAETGTVTLESGGVTCEMFYTAYTRDDAEDANDRPVTFAFNGGPGSSSYYIQFCLGPRRPELDESGYSLALPGKMIDNENSILDMTDLVFIDPVGTGYSHAVNEEETGEFLGYENDIRSVGDFIRHYINRHERWGSQKFIAGESYGTTRAVGLCEYLADQYSMYLNGLMLLSSVNDYGAVLELPGNDNPTVFYVPTFAADAWYHGKLSEEYQTMELEDYLEEVRTFVETEYAPALFLGRKIREDKKEQIAEKLAGYIGLSKDFVLKNDLRVSLEDFSVELLSDEKLMVGRYDGRITGPVINDGVSDPSGSEVDIAFFGPYMEYLTEELKFQTDAPFIPLSLEVNWAWSFADNYGAIAQEDVIYKCMSRNPYLKVWVLCGYYDSATPFYSSEWVYDHVFINEDRAKNLTFTYYPAGHMFYIDRESYDKFRKDAEEWYKDASAEDELSAFPQLTTEDFDLSRYDGDEMYFDCHGNIWSLTDESAEKYPNLVKPLKEIADNEKKSFEDTLDQYDAEAKKYAEENRGDDNFFVYARYADTGLASADSKRVSLVSTQFTSVGMAHPETVTIAYNIDAVSGQYIPLSAVIADKDGLNAMLKEALTEQYKDHSFFGLDESLKELQMALPAFQTDKPSYNFSFSPNGLTFYFDPATISPYSDGGEQIDLTYDELSSVLDERFRIK